MVALYALDALWLRPATEGLPLGRLAIVGLLLLPLRGVWRRDGRSAFWYAIICTLPVTHALLLALDDRTRAFGLTLLAVSSALFIVACAFARQRGLRSS